MTIKTEILKIVHGKDTLHLFRAFTKEKADSLPVLLLFPSWKGRDNSICDMAKLFAEKGFMAIAVDLYGEAQIGMDRAACQSLISPFVTDRLFLKSRLEKISHEIQKDSKVDPEKISALGYCFGGLCVLDMVRNNMGLNAGISVHGLLGAPNYDVSKQYNAKVLAFHGYKDPMVTPDQKVAFENEMHAAEADWQLIIYGKGYHAFTTTGANDVAFGTVYDPLLDQRTTRIINSFLDELR